MSNVSSPAPVPTTLARRDARPDATALDALTRDARAALQRGDAAGTLAAFAGGRALDSLTTTESIALARKAVDVLIAYRRLNVATIGAHDAFVRKFANGSLEQVVKPVTLSLADGTLYQLPTNGKFIVGTNKLWKKGDEGRWEWSSKVANPLQANLSAEGLHRLNDVAGCHIGHLPSVNVDGVERANPYIERSESVDGGPGEIVRIVIAISVVGTASATGNPVAVRYVLDYDPRVDLRLALMTLVKGGWTKDEDEEEGGGTRAAANKVVDYAKLIPSKAFPAFQKKREEEHGDGMFWACLSLMGGLSVAYNVADANVMKALDKCLKSGVHLVKKAQTVAIRNAMRMHPALAYRQVACDENGVARIPMVGWTHAGKGDAWVKMLDRVARGMSLPEDIRVEVRDVAETYTETHAAEDANLDAVRSGDLDAVIEVEEADAPAPIVTTVAPAPAPAPTAAPSPGLAPTPAPAPLATDEDGDPAMPWDTAPSPMPSLDPAVAAAVPSEPTSRPEDDDATRVLRGELLDAIDEFVAENVLPTKDMTKLQILRTHGAYGEIKEFALRVGVKWGA